MRGATLAALASAALLLAPAVAQAHAVLEEVSPARGADLERAPDEVTMRFNEPVEASFGAVRVYDSDAERVDTGELVRPDESSEAIGVALEDGLGDGTYTTTYRVVSADSHPVSGGFVFTVGDPPSASAVAVDELIDDAGSGPVTDAAFGVTRIASYAGTAIVIGAIFLLVWCWSPALSGLAGPESRWRVADGAFARRMRAVLIAGLVAGAVASALGIVLQGALALGETFWSALSPDVLADVIGTRFGTAWLLRLVDFVALAGLCLVPALGMRLGALSPAGPEASESARGGPLRAHPAAVLALGLGLGYLALTPALAGHPGVTDPSWLSVAMSFVHVLAFSVWLGGLASLLLAVPTATKALEGGERTALLSRTLSRFSAVALVSVAALLATGVVQAVLQLEAWSELIDTGYGRAILVKAALLGVLIGFGAHNRRRSLPALTANANAEEPPGHAGAVLRRTLRFEVGLIAGVLVATAVLAATAPLAATTEGPYSTSAELGSASVDVTVDPATVGDNEIHIYLFEGETGAQYDATKEFGAEASLAAQDIGPLELETRKAGPGHYVVRGAPLGVPGDWTLELSSRVSAFEEHRTDVEVPIR
jgi:copper transport protein